MTADQVKAIYEEMEQMVVPLDHVPERGLEYLKEQMLLCRRHQDRVAMLLLQSNREVSRLRIAQRGLRAQLRLASPSNQAIVILDQLRAVEDELDNCKYLLEAVEVKRGNLRQVNSDIRLLVNVVTEQLKIGEVRGPKDAPVADPLAGQPSAEPVAEQVFVRHDEFGRHVDVVPGDRQAETPTAPEPAREVLDALTLPADAAEQFFEVPPEADIVLGPDGCPMATRDMAAGELASITLDAAADLLGPLAAATVAAENEGAVKKAVVVDDDVDIEAFLNSR